MALTQAMSTAITGLMTHQRAMDNIGNNLANVNTAGFKKGVYQFTTVLEQTLRGGIGANASTNRGSINPISLGLGAQTGSINKVFTQGAIEHTGNPYDMAIDGNGFFVLRQGNGNVYTRGGSFYKGEDGTLMAGAGLYVQGTLAVRNSDGSYSIPQDAKLQDIVIPIGATGGHAQTSKVGFTGNLDSRQELSVGLSLFGGSSYPTVSSLQSWMKKDFNGGDPLTDSKVDNTWNSLEQSTFAISEATRNSFADRLAGTNLPGNVTVYSQGVVTDMIDDNQAVYWVLDVSNPANPVAVRVADAGKGESPLTIGDIRANHPNYVPLIEEISTINGGNVQTSAAYGVEVPDMVRAGSYYTGADGRTYAISQYNNFTYPQWFYESTGASGSYEDIVNRNNALAAAINDGTATAEDIDAAIRATWPNGINGTNDSGWASSPALLGMTNLPYSGETFPASLNTPLEELQYLKGNVWVKPYANIKNGDEVTITFNKGDSQIEATFKYNRPTGAGPFNGQSSVNQELSYTLEHLLTFLAGDVDEPSVACQNITPAMFGAPVTADFPEGNYNAADWDREGYEDALKNSSLAKQDTNLDSVGGAMGLLSIPPQISDSNYGHDAYDAPLESAGAYSRTGVQTVTYKRWNASTNSYDEYKAPSFNTSIVSNLGIQNAITDIRISYNNVTHEAMYNGESDYNAPQGGSSVVSVDFYDSLGNPKTATLRMVMVDQTSDFTTWRWYADCLDDTDFPWQVDENTGEIISSLNVGTGLIRFDKSGNFVKGSDFSETGGITINQSNQGVSDPIVISIFNSLSSASSQNLDFSDLTCSATDTSFKLAEQNGRPPGTLYDFTVGLDGTIQGIYDNGAVVALARIGLAVIPNENGLIAAGSNLFMTGPASGEALYGHAGTGGSGNVRYQQLEASNVDLSEEFTKLISIERGFQANSRTITTADEMITELLNLKR